MAKIVSDMEKKSKVKKKTSFAIYLGYLGYLGYLLVGPSSFMLSLRLTLTLSLTFID